MAGQTVDQTQPTTKEENRKVDQNVAQELKKLQIQFQDAFRRYRDLIGQSVCDDHARHLNSMRIVLINKEIKQINAKQLSLFKRWRRTKEARRMQLKLARRRRLESDIDERFSFHFSARFRRHWEMALERLSVHDKADSLELKSLALLDIVPRNVDKELRLIERDEPVAPLRVHLMKELGREKGSGGKKRRNRLMGSAGGSGEEGRAFKAPRCSKRIRGVSPSEQHEGGPGPSATQSGASSFAEDCPGPEGIARSQSAPAGVEKLSEDVFACSPSPKSCGPPRLSEQSPHEAFPPRKARSVDLRDVRRSFCCAFCRRIRRVSASVWSDDGVLWCRRCRPSSAESSALDSNTDKSSGCALRPRPAGVANGDENTSHSTVSTSSTTALQ